MREKSIAVIRQLFENGEITEEIVEQLKQDDRKGVQALVRKHAKLQEKKQQQIIAFREMCYFENEARNSGRKLVAGVDEAGRGPLAGPVVAASVILPQDFKLLGLNDSKQLSEKDRDYFYAIIKEQAISYHIAVISNETIDQMNILEATKLAMYEAVRGLEKQPNHVLIDAVQLPELKMSSEAIIKGDARSVSIAAASVLAKVTRDRLMKEIHNEFPMYDFNSNMGYGTKKHLEGLQSYGISPYHRKSFAPIREFITY
ncbi:MULTISPECIES: ribonuclease HII [unclassified Oceanobacillus]|uniref:ribonuclease HII n=1 Tax=unclassified Oceanobacillus TaxID=2630292 RepID=UPI0012EBBBFF|nr:ribonuclease HII [Oceanobacillus sp. AG]